MIKISESSKKIDVRGLFCPSPALQTTVELSKMQVGEILTVLADDPDSENTTDYSEAIVFEFSESGTLKFDEIVGSLQTSMITAINAAELGSNPPAPARLGVNIEGAELLRFETNGLQIIRLEQKEKEPNKFAIARALP